MAKGGLTSTLTFLQAQKNRKLHRLTGIKPYTRLNLWLTVWGPLFAVLAGIAIEGGVLVPLCVLAAALWVGNIVYLVVKFKSQNCVGKAICYNIVSSILYFFGFIFAPFLKLVVGLGMGAVSMQTGNFSAATYHNAEGFEAAGKSRMMFVYNLIKYDGENEYSYDMPDYMPGSPEMRELEEVNADKLGYSSVYAAIDDGVSYSALHDSL